MLSCIRTAPDGDNGLEFLGAFSDSGGGSGSNSLIGYNVSELTYSSMITGSTISTDPSWLGGNGVVSVTESFLQSPADILYLTNDVPTNEDFAYGSNLLFEHPSQSLDVRGDVFASASGNSVVMSAL